MRTTQFRGEFIADIAYWQSIPLYVCAANDSFPEECSTAAHDRFLPIVMEHIDDDSLSNQSDKTYAKCQSAMKRSSPAGRRSSAVGAGAVALAGRSFVRQLRSPPKAWCAQHTVALQGGNTLCRNRGMRSKGYRLIPLDEPEDEMRQALQVTD